jgi:serine/threonine protein kinase
MHTAATEECKFQFEPGAYIGKYIVTEPYALGAIKEVYKARPIPGLPNHNDPSEGLITVVAKVFRQPEKITSPRSLENLRSVSSEPEEGDTSPDIYSSIKLFLDEVNALSSLQQLGGHPNIAKILDAGIYDIPGTKRKILYFTEEFIPGDTLAQRLESIPPDGQDLKQMPIDDALEIFVQVASGINYLHDHDMGHFDIQPGNIIITPDGKAKLTDFGTARLVTSEEDIKRGTILYRAPEEFIGRSPGKPSDVWAMGVLLYQALTGKYPFETVPADWSGLSSAERANVEQQLRENIAFDRITHIPKYNKNVSESLKRVVYDSLERMPDKRINIREVYARLHQEILCGDPARCG